MSEYYECSCGQVVQGFVAMQQIECCDDHRYKRIEGPSLSYDPIPADHYIANVGRELLGHALESRDDWRHVRDILANAFVYVCKQLLAPEDSHDRDN